MVNISYEEFCDYVKNNAQYLLGDLNFHVDFIPYEKNNIRGEGIILSSVSNQSLVPGIALEELYNRFLNSFDGQEIEFFLSDFLDSMKNKLQNELTIQVNESSQDYSAREYIMDNVFVKLVNTYQNKDLLAISPHQDLLDLSMMCRVKTYQGNDELGSFLLTNKVLDQLKITPDEILGKALQNTQLMFPSVVRSMSGMMIDMLDSFDQDDPGFLKEQIQNGIGLEKEPYVVTNSMGINGASAMLYTGLLDNLAAFMKDDLYILPSSLHEVLCLPKADNDVNDLTDMVRTVNMECVDLSDRLSNQVYKYDRKKKVLSIVSDGKCKALDGRPDVPERTRKPKSR